MCVPVERVLHVPRLIDYEKLHLYAGELDYVVIVESASLGADRIAVDYRVRTFYVGNEIALRTSGDHRDLYAGAPKCNQRLAKFEFFAHAGAAQYLNLAQRSVARACGFL